MSAQAAPPTQGSLAPSPKFSEALSRAAASAAKKLEAAEQGGYDKDTAPKVPTIGDPRSGGFEKPPTRAEKQEALASSGQPQPADPSSPDPDDKIIDLPANVRPGSEVGRPDTAVLAEGEPGGAPAPPAAESEVDPLDTRIAELEAQQNKRRQDQFEAVQRQQQLAALPPVAAPSPPGAALAPQAAPLPQLSEYEQKLQSLDPEDLTPHEAMLRETNLAMAQQLREIQATQAQQAQQARQAEQDRYEESVRGTIKDFAIGEYPDVFGDGNPFGGDDKVTTLQDSFLYKTQDDVQLIAARMAKKHRDGVRKLQQNYVQSKVRQAAERPAPIGGSSQAPMAPKKAPGLKHEDLVSGRVQARAYQRMMRSG